MITGEGLSGVLLLTSDPADQKNFLLDRLIRQTGMKREDFYFGVAEEGWFSQAKSRGVKVVMPLGEKALRRSTGNTEIYRWRGRVIENPDFPFYTLPTFNPKYLLPRKRAKDPITGQPLRDPEYLNRPARFQGRFRRDLGYARHIAQYGFQRVRPTYLLDPGPEAFARWVDDYLRALDSGAWIRLAFDMETPYKTDHASDEEEQEEKQKFNERNLDIIRWSFSYEFAKAVTIPNQGVYRKSIERLLKEKADKVTTNGRDFDYPVASYNNYELNGRHFDTFDLMKFWQSDLDKGLEVASADTTDLLPWKHLSDARPDFYAATDADASWREAEYIIAEIQRQGAWEVFLETFTDLMPHMVAAGNRGNAIDLGRQEQLRIEFTSELQRLDEEIQKVVPEHLKPRKRYKKDPVDRERPYASNALNQEDTVEWIEQDGRRFVPVLEPNEINVCSNCGAKQVTKGGHTSRVNLGEKILLEERHHPKQCSLGGTLAPLLMSDEVDAVTSSTIPTSSEPTVSCSCPKGWPKRKWDSSGVTKNPCHGAELRKEIHPTVEWDEILPFNVNSSAQLIDYMKAYDHPVGTNPDDPDKDSADAQHMKMLARTYGEKHPVYALAGEAKLIGKAKSTYLWIPSSSEVIDGEEVQLIHQTYKNVPNTLRMSGTAYNLMNVGKKEDKNKWAVMARNQIVARPGYVFVNADSTSVEGVMQGWYMGDEHYMWLANQSIHAWLVTKYLGWDFNPDMVDKVKKEKKKLYDGMKVMVYTTNFGGSAYGAHMANRDLFPSWKDAEKIQNIIFKLLPTLEAYQYHQRYLAQKQGYIESPWKWRGYFYDVYTYKRDRFGNIEYTESGRPKLKLSKDGKRVVAVLPQHSNAMFARQNLKRIGDSEWGQYMPANVFVHDGYQLEVPIRRAEEAEDFLLNLLSRPIPEMGGLRVGAASDIGYNWGDHSSSNPKGMKSSRKIVVEKQELNFMPRSAAVPDEMLRAA